VRAGCLYVALLVACDQGQPASAPRSDASDGATDAPTTPKIVLVADRPSHGPREHEGYAGATLLATMLAQQSPRVETTVIRTFPDDASAFDGAAAIVLITNGGSIHPLVVAPARADALASHLARGAGLVAIHWSTEVTPELGPRMLSWLGGCAVRPESTFPIWPAHFDALPEHPITSGVPPFELEDEWYFNLRFAGSSPGFLPILRAVPPESARTSEDARRFPGRTETVAWAFEREDGGRSFGYTGMHFHATWGRPEVRRLVVNAILWSARREVPAGGAPVEMAPALLDRDLDPK
jgi:hypothetical protein